MPTSVARLLDNRALGGQIVVIGWRGKVKLADLKIFGECTRQDLTPDSLLTRRFRVTPSLRGKFCGRLQGEFESTGGGGLKGRCA